MKQNNTVDELNQKPKAEEVSKAQEVKSDDNLQAQTGTTEDNKETTQKDRILEISFDYNRESTQATNQYAVWIEDNEGNVVRTLYVSSFTATGGYSQREDSIPTWVEHANPSEMSSEEIDAVSGATPGTGRVTYQWDGTDDNGTKLPMGEYTFCVEGTLYWSSVVTFSGQVVLGADEDTDIDIQAEYSEDTDTNRDMIQNVSAKYATI